MAAPPRIDRVSADDLMSLVAERGSTPMQVGVVLLLDSGAGLDPAQALGALGRRIPGVPRLRQRLMAVPVGCGRPVWVDDAAFSATTHLTSTRCPAPGGEAALLSLAADLIATPLPQCRPLWTATLVTDIAPGEAAVIVVFHHVLADGIGGLAVLASLVDRAPDTGAPVTGAPVTDAPEAGALETGAPQSGDPATGAPQSGDPLFPSQRPTAPRLALDAARGRIRSLFRIPAALKRIGSAAAELRSTARARVAATSLNRPTGPRRSFVRIRVDLGPVRSAAHARGATVNDAVLTAIGGALHRLLKLRGERVVRFVVSVPFSARRQASAGDLGNRSGVISLAIPGTGDPAARLDAVAELTRAAKRAPPGASTALLGPLFRLLARAGLYQRFIDRQRLVHTFVTTLRGPEERLALFGCPITGIIPLSVAAGNVTVSFAVLSYAGTLSVTIIADPDAAPDLPALRQALLDELDELEALVAST